jgi:hypothetical protein
MTERRERTFQMAERANTTACWYERISNSRRGEEFVTAKGQL